MKLPVITLLLFPLLAHGQWTQVSMPTTSSLYCIDSYSAQDLCIGSSGEWLRSSDGGASWQVEPILDQFGFPWTNVAFYGMAYRGPGNLFGTGLVLAGQNNYQVQRTTNDGANWNTVFNATGSGAFSALRGIAWNPNNTTRAVAFGDNGRITRTTDGGVVWDGGNTFSNAYYDAAWTGDATVLVAGANRIVRSTDSGNNWTSIGMPNVLQAISFPTPTLGFAAGNGAVIHRSVDGGVTWADMGAGLPPGLPDIADLRFIDATEGYALADTMLLHTTNGGLHWEWFPCAAEMRMLHFTSAGDGFAVGLEGTVYRIGGPGAYRPFAVWDLPVGTLCHNTPTTFTSTSGPGLAQQWSINGEQVGTGATLEWTFSEPAQNDTLMLVVSNGTYTDTVTQVVSIGASSAIVNNAVALNDTVCSGASGTVQVPASQPGTNYRLFRDGVPAGGQQSGNTSTLNFTTGALTAPTLLQLVATRNLASCGFFTDTVVVDFAIGNPDALLTVAPGPQVACRGDAVTITVDDSQPWATYQLRRNGVNEGSAQPGTGGTIGFTTLPFAGNATYSVLASSTLSVCTSVLQATVPVTLEVPQLGWGATAFNPLVGSTVDFMNSSTVLGGTYAWSFGAGVTPTTSTLAEPQDVVFGTPGTYTVQLIGTTPAGCADTLSQVVHAVNAPAPQDCGVTQLTNNGQFPNGLSIAVDGAGNMYSWSHASISPEQAALSGAGDTLYRDLPFDVLDLERNGTLFKYDASGIPQWSVGFWYHTSDANLSDMAVADDGTIYSAYFHGEQTDSLFITDASGAVLGLNPTQQPGINSTVITSFDTQGRLRWVKQVPTNYTNDRLRIILDGTGHLILQTTDRLVQFDADTGDQLWSVFLNEANSDMEVLANGHIVITERFDMVMREYDNTGTLLNTTPAFMATPAGGDFAQLAGWFSASDAGGAIYNVHSLFGQVVLGGDTLTRPYGSDLWNFFLAQRTLDGGVVWHRTMRWPGQPRFQGMQVHAGRVLIALTFFSTDTLYMDGLPPLLVDNEDTWLLGYDTDGNNPMAFPLHRYGPGFPHNLTTWALNAFAVDPQDQRMALWVAFNEELVLGTDTATSFNGFQVTVPSGPQNAALLFGGYDCLAEQLTADFAPAAYFEPPVGYCEDQPMTFADASLYGATTWQWSFPGGTPATSTDPQPQVTYATAGSHPVTLITTNANGTSEPFTTTVEVDICADVAALARQIAAGPNPVQDVVWLALPTALARPALIEVRDPAGRLVHSEYTPGAQQLRLDTRAWGSGVRFVHLHVYGLPPAVVRIVVL